MLVGRAFRSPQQSLLLRCSLRQSCSRFRSLSSHARGTQGNLSILRAAGWIGLGTTFTVVVREMLMGDRQILCEEIKKEPTKPTSKKFKAPSASALAAYADYYGGVIVEPTAAADCDSVEEFSEKLSSSIDTWRKEGRRGVWLKIPSDCLTYASAAVQQNFFIHHAEKEHIMLALWLPEEQGEPCTLPSYTSHTVGVGAMVIDEEQRLLVVQERTGPAAGIDFWKIPTGLVDAGEDAAAAAAREVREETGVEAEVVSLLALRETHHAPGGGWMSGKTNVFMVFLLKPTSTEIKLDGGEIAQCQWMDYDEYLAKTSKRMPEGTLYYELNSLGRAAHNGDVTAFKPRKMKLGFRPGENMIYSPERTKSRL